MQVKVNGKSKTVTDILSAGPGCPPHTFEFSDGSYVYLVGEEWKLVRPRPIGPCGRVTVEWKR